MKRACQKACLLATGRQMCALEEAKIVASGPRVLVVRLLISNARRCLFCLFSCKFEKARFLACLGASVLGNKEVLVLTTLLVSRYTYWGANRVMARRFIHLVRQRCHMPLACEGMSWE